MVFVGKVKTDENALLWSETIVLSNVNNNNVFQIVKNINKIYAAFSLSSKLYLYNHFNCLAEADPQGSSVQAAGFSCTISSSLSSSLLTFITFFSLALPA